MTERKPKIRFKGFTDAWEQRKLSELVQIERGGSPRPIDDFITDSPNGLNWVKISDAPIQGHYITKTTERIRPEGLKKTREVYPGDLILSNSMSFGKPYIMSIYGCIHDGWLLIRNVYNVFDLTFLCHLLGTSEMLNQYKALAAGSTVSNLNKELVGNTIIIIPQRNEQRVLANFLEYFDALLTLHQRKLDQLKTIKKSLLEKMFPKNGKSVPDIRFKGFTDAWEQRKLGEITGITKGQQINKAQLDDSGLYYVLNGGRTPSGYTDTFNTKANTISISEGGNSCGYVNYNYEPFWSGGHNYTLLNPKIDTFYLYQVLKLREPQIMALRVGSGLPNIQKNRLQEIEITFPKEKEQKKLGKVFANLDNLITLHQRKLEALKNLKSAMLEKMFV